MTEISDRKPLDELYRQRCGELMEARKELEETRKHMRFLLDENDRLRRQRPQTESDGSRKLPDSEFLLAIKQIEASYGKALEHRKKDKRVKLPPRLSVRSVATFMGITDAAIHRGYPHIRSMIHYHQGKTHEDAIKKYKAENKDLKEKVRQVKAERDERYLFCERMANILFADFVGRSSFVSPKSQNTQFDRKATLRLIHSKYRREHEERGTENAILLDLCNLLPSQHRENESLKDSISKYLGHQGNDYVKRNILYSNRYVQQSDKYPVYFSKALKEDWAEEWWKAEMRHEKMAQKQLDSYSTVSEEKYAQNDMQENPDSKEDSQAFKNLREEFLVAIKDPDNEWYQACFNRLNSFQKNTKFPDFFEESLWDAFKLLVEEGEIEIQNKHE